MADLTLDTRGRRCPFPVIELARRIGELAPGDVVAVVSDDAAAGPDIRAWCRLRGQDYVGAEEEPPGAVTYRVRRR
ncbi:MAG TPA: sulfurtransferase TusA family protein [Mycobacteriales bacterium]|nr:sulfurtransferase TusA family protein [Mycobacteriales bacterium]